MDIMASQITSLTIVYSNVYSGADQSKTGEFPAKGPVTRKVFHFDDVIMNACDVDEKLYWITHYNEPKRSDVGSLPLVY